MEEPDATDWTDAIRALAPWAARVRAPGFAFGAWHDAEERDGVLVMPWFELSPDGSSLLAAAGAFLLPGFAWPDWIGTDEARRLHDDPAALSTATPHQIAQLLTALIRQDRLAEGALDAAVQSGLMGRLLDRVAQLAAG